MNFLVLLLVVCAEKFSDWRQRIQNDSPWLALFQRGQNCSAWLQLTLLVLLPVAVLAAVLFVLKGFAYGLLAFPVHVLVLIYSLGRGDLQAALGPFRDSWRRADAEAAYLVAKRDLGIDADSPSDLLSRVQGHMVWQGYQSFFAVIFWYALLGPVAALAYRLLALAAEHAVATPLGGLAKQLRHAFDWLPVRVLATSFALVGNFAAVSRSVLEQLLNWDISAEQLVAHAAAAASETPTPELGAAGIDALDAQWQLMVRAAVLWYAIFALWTLYL